MITKNYFYLVLCIFVLNNNSVFGQYIWTKDAQNPVLTGSGAGTWDAIVFSACVLYNPDSARFEMWYTGATEVWVRPFHIGYAVSPDGINWTKHPTPVLSPDSEAWDNFAIEEATVLRENGQYKMWYTSGWISQIGYATSSDGINWTKYSGNPVLVQENIAWEASGPYYCSVIPVSDGYFMWYVGYNENWSDGAIGVAFFNRRHRMGEIQRE